MFKYLLVLMTLSLACASQTAFVCEVSMGDLGVRECGFDSMTCVENGCAMQSVAWCFTRRVSEERKTSCAASLRECESARESEPGAGPLCWKTTLQEVRDFM